MTDGFTAVMWTIRKGGTYRGSSDGWSKDCVQPTKARAIEKVCALTGGTWGKLRGAGFYCVKVRVTEDADNG